MKVFYVTFESISFDPILLSQVIPLIERLSKIYNLSLVTFESNVTDEKLITGNSFKHYTIKRSGALLNQIYFINFLLKNKDKFDVLHVRGYLPIFTSLFMKLIFGKIVIFDPRGVFPDEILYTRNSKTSLIKVFAANFVKILEPFIYKYSDHIVVVSERFKNYLLTRINLIDNKITTIPTFSIPSKNSDLIIDFRSEYGWNDNILICYSGSMEKWQNFDLVIKFFVYLSSKSDKFRFCFFSKNILEMKDKVELNLNSSICHFASLPPDKLTMAISNCDYGVLLRDSHLVNVVSAPIKVKDYLFSGIKLICTDNIGDTSNIVIKNNLGVVLSFSDIFSFDYKSILEKISFQEKKRVIDVITELSGLEFALSEYINIYEGLNFGND